MGCNSSSLPVQTNQPNDKNIHVVHSDIKVHTVVSAELDFDHKTAMHIPLVSIIEIFIRFMSNSFLLFLSHRHAFITLKIITTNYYLLQQGEVTDEQLLAEVARRHLDIHDKITDSMVKVSDVLFFHTP